MSDDKKFRLGKHPKKLDRRNLKMASYLPLALPAPPPAVDRASKLKGIGMMGNDKYGNCTIAAAGHMVQSWSVYAERGQQNIPDSEIIKAYLTISPADDGAFMLDALNYWRKTGVGTDKIEAFVEVEPRNVTQAKLAIQYFGAVYIGMALPSSNTFGPWTEPVGPGNPYNGHAVCLVAYDDKTKMFKACTWGQIWDLSYAWYESYADEAYAVLNDLSLIKSSGLTPSGFDWNKLSNDLNHIGEPVTDPVPVPTPEPTPTPTPDPDPVSPPEPAPTPDPVDPRVLPTGILITGIDSAYWVVYGNGTMLSRHVSQLEAVESATNILYATPTMDVRIVHDAVYTVKVK